MEDAKARFVAALFGVAATCGLWLARPANRPTPFRVLDQWTPASAAGPDADAAAVFRLELRGAVRAAVEEGRAVEFRLFGRDGRSCPLAPMEGPGDRGAMKLAKGYAFSLEEPRLVAFVEGKPVVGVSVGAVPAPIHKGLVPTPHPPLVVLLRPGGGVRLAPTLPIPSDERWRVHAVRTDHADMDAWVDIGSEPDRREPRRFAVPYAEQAERMEVEILRYRLVPESEVVRIPGFRLERRFNGIALLVDRPVQVPTHLGIDVRLPRQNNGPRRFSARSKPGIVFANLSLLPREPAVRPIFGHVSGLQILSPSLASLGLRELRVGGATLRGEGVPGPPRVGPFEITARVTVYRRVPLGSFRAVVPVRYALPSDPRPGETSAPSPKLWR